MWLIKVTLVKTTLSTSNRRGCQFQRPPTTAQNLDFFTCTTSGRSAKLFTRNALPGRLQNLHNPVQSACTCYKCTRRFHTAYPWQSHSCEQLCWFPGCAGKKIQISFSRWWRLELATSSIGIISVHQYINDL